MEDGVTGLAVPPGHVEYLRDAIQFLIAHPRERKRLGRNAQDAFHARFTLDAYVGRILDHMRDIAAAGRKVQPVTERSTEATA